MYKFAIVSLLAVGGCSSVAEDLRPFVAVAGRYSLMAHAKPAPAPSTACMNCRGTGKVGDGTVMSTCPICKGTGKVVSSSAPCKDGACPKSTSR
jgi:RecJ-like exonuclease